MVYKNVSPTISQRVLTRTDAALPKSHWPNAPHSPQSAIFFSRECLPVSLLRTCKQVHDEAGKTMQAKMQELKS
jgi:hypothetical protein